MCQQRVFVRNQNSQNGVLGLLGWVEIGGQALQEREQHRPSEVAPRDNLKSLLHQPRDVRWAGPLRTRSRRRTRCTTRQLRDQHWTSCPTGGTWQSPSSDSDIWALLFPEPLPRTCLVRQRSDFQGGETRARFHSAVGHPPPGTRPLQSCRGLDLWKRPRPPCLSRWPIPPSRSERDSTSVFRGGPRRTGAALPSCSPRCAATQRSVAP